MWYNGSSLEKSDKMNPTALQIGPFSIKWYSLMILLGVIAGIGLLLKEGK